MIKVRITRHAGFFQIGFSGHANPDACAGASMIMQAAALGLRDLARCRPSQVTVEIDGPPLDSRRK